MLDRIAAELFEVELLLPDDGVHARSKRLVGFDQRYQQIERDLRLISSPEEVEAWSKKHHKRVLPLCDVVSERYPLLVFEGDVGTGKTAMAEAACDRLARQTGKPAVLFKLSTRVRGTGKVGEMSSLINQAFEVVAKEAGKSRVSFLLIDEADSLSAHRDGAHSHHEDKVAVNTIIQKVDDVRRLGGRVVVILCTNRLHALDPAVLRRAARVERFSRPTSDEREALFRMDYDGLDLPEAVFKELVALTGPQGKGRLGMTFSDLRSRLLPEALAAAFPNRKLTGEDLLEAARRMQPSPAVGDGS